MEFRKEKFVSSSVALLCLWTSACGLLSPKGVNFEVQALMGIKKFLVDPHGVLDNWDEYVDPCSWNMVTCSTDGLVIGLLLQNNNISGEIPIEIGRLTKLRTLDLSENCFSGTIPSSLANMVHLTSLDLSFNNLSGPFPESLSKAFKTSRGGTFICDTSTEGECYAKRADPSNDSQPLESPPSGRPKTKSQKKKALAFGSGVGCICLLVFPFISLFLRQKRRKQQELLNANAKTEEEECIGNLKRFQFEELVIATNNFSSRSIVGRGGFGNVYKGHLKDGTVVAVKRLKDGNAAGGETQFQTELKIISLAVHRNLLQLYGFCMTATERLLVYPFMSNGSVASRLKAKPALDWGTRKRITLGTARGLVYLHEQCDPKIIHRDVKAANVLLDDQYEPVVGDFGLVKIMEHLDSHVTTAVRGTIGYIAPEYLSTGQSSDRTDVFAFGILLLELMTGKKPSEFEEMAIEEKAMIDWVKKIYMEKRFDELIDKGLGNIYDQVELERMIQLSVSCTQYDPNDRPKMSEVLQILEETN
ncbi:hypothetical protein REPUB_Repub01dG0035900 [Reevesia pubescens]